MTAIFDLSIACANQIKQRFSQTGEVEEFTLDDIHGIDDTVFTSLKYRRAHISIVDARETKKLWLLHVTVFPHANDPSPIYGFDIVCGPNKVSGAFHDFSSAGEPNHRMMAWFADQTKMLEWNKKRELPEWAKNIFSSSMVAIGAVGSEELIEFVDLGLKTLDYYLENVGNTQESLADYHMAQNRYCRYQKQNPHTPRVLVSLGFTEQEAKDFVEQNLFPEIV
jgi:hypothetical protein